MPGGHPRGRRRLRPRRTPPPALDGLGRNGTQLSLRRLLLAATQVRRGLTSDVSNSAGSIPTLKNHEL